MCVVTVSCSDTCICNRTHVLFICMIEIMMAYTCFVAHVNEFRLLKFLKYALNIYTCVYVLFSSGIEILIVKLCRPTFARVTKFLCHMHRSSHEMLHQFFACITIL